MKKKSHIVIDCVLILLSLVFFVLLAYINYIQFYMIDGAVKVICYGLCAICYLRAFSIFSKKMKSQVTKWAFALIPSTLFTLQIIFYNPFLHYLRWNYSGISSPYMFPYRIFLKEDLTYKIGLGAYRFLFCFIVMYALCAVEIILEYERVKNIVLKFKHWFSPLFASNEETSLELLLQLYAQDRIDFDAIVDFCNSMKHSMRQKEELKECIEEYGYKILYNTLFEKFGFDMMKDEYLEYRESYLDRYGFPLCNACSELDRRFNLTI